MAIVNKQTKCSICQRSVGDSDVIAFPPFVKNRMDPFYAFHDAAVHRTCLDSHPEKHAILAARDAGLGDRVCAACGEVIDIKSAAFSAGLLTSNPENLAYKFNCIDVHLSHFNQWQQSEEFQASLSTLVNSRLWQGPRLLFDPLPRWVPEEGGADESAPGQKRVVVISRPSETLRGTSPEEQDEEA
jgi:hypothetical protein